MNSITIELIHAYQRMRTECWFEQLFRSICR